MILTLELICEGQEHSLSFLATLECINFEEKPSSALIVSISRDCKTTSNQSVQTDYMILRCAGIMNEVYCAWL